MSTIFLYHAFGLPGYDYVWQEFVGGNVLLHVRAPRASWSAAHAVEAAMSSIVA